MPKIFFFTIALSDDRLFPDESRCFKPLLICFENFLSYHVIKYKYIYLEQIHVDCLLLQLLFYYYNK